MKKCLVMITLLVGCIGQNEKNQAVTEYYTKITGIVSPYMDYRPRGEVMLENVGSQPYYKVQRDSHGNLEEISYYKYSKESNDSYFGAHKVMYQRYPDSLIRSYFNTDGKPMFMNRHYYGGGAIHKEVFSLNISGVKQELTFKDTIGEKVTTGFGTYRYTWKSKDENAFEQEQFKKDGSRNYLTTYFPFYKSSVTIDKKGHLFSMANLDTITGSPVIDENTGYAMVLFDFDEFGNEKGWSFHDTEGKLVIRKPLFGMEHGYAKVVYDFEWVNEELGLIKSFSTKFLDDREQNTVSNDSIHSTRFEFDEYDNLISLAYFDEKEQPKSHPATNYHKVTLLYDQNGKQTGSVKYDEDGNQIK